MEWKLKISRDAETGNQLFYIENGDTREYYDTLEKAQQMKETREFEAVKKLEVLERRKK